METTTFEIDGMSCDHCVKVVRTALDQLEGVEVEAVEIGRASVRYDPDAIHRATIAHAIEEKDYPVTNNVAS
jgi:copper chaperone CopZ